MYYIEDIKTHNMFYEQQYILYLLLFLDDCQIVGAVYIEKSQVVDLLLNKRVLIPGRIKHSYEVRITFDGNSQLENDSVFKGVIEIDNVNK